MFKVNFQSRVPVYKQLYENVIKLVSLGVLMPNDKLPTVRAMATELGINPNTVSKTYSMLEHDGYIYSAVGRGSFISDNFSNSEAKRLESVKTLRSAIKSAMLNGVSKEDALTAVKDIFNGGDIDD
ncbi:MAG: GntR family transcriptional regulator [Ruminococcus sp.]|nr:GntR family transcriptional regulator [Ruminococcus sp.]